jgi:hypothetical protein
VWLRTSASNDGARDSALSNTRTIPWHPSKAITVAHKKNSPGGIKNRSENTDCLHIANRPNETKLSRDAEGGDDSPSTCCDTKNGGITPGSVGFSAWLGPSRCIPPGKQIQRYGQNARYNGRDHYKRKVQMNTSVRKPPRSREGDYDDDKKRVKP